MFLLHHSKVVLVNVNSFRPWRDTVLSDSGKFWKLAHLSVDASRYPSQATDLLTSRILFIAPRIKISPGNLEEPLLRVITEGKTPQLKKLTGIFAQVSPQILAGAALKVERLWANLISPQLQAILKEITATKDHKLKELHCWTWNDHSGIDPQFLSAALVKLETVSGFKLLPGQILSLFSRIRDSPDLRLAELRLGNSNVSMVPPDVFVRAVSRLGSVEFREVSADQLEALFRKLFYHQAGAGDTKLRQLKLWGPNLSSISPSVLVGAIQKLEVVELQLPRLTAAQFIEVLTMLKENQQRRLKHIQILDPTVSGSWSQTLLQEAQGNNAVETTIVTDLISYLKDLIPM